MQFLKQTNREKRSKERKAIERSPFRREIDGNDDDDENKKMNDSVADHSRETKIARNYSE